MPSPEGPPTEPGAFYASVLNATPVLPFDTHDVASQVFNTSDPESLGPGYAWMGVREWVVDIQQTLRSTSGPVIDLELCSSTPLASAHSAAREADHSRLRAREIASMLVSGETAQQLKQERPELLPISKALARSASGRALLEAAITKTLFELTPEQSVDAEILGRVFFDILTEQRYVYVREPVPGDLESSWGLRVRPKENKETYLEAISSLRIPTLKAAEARSLLAQGGTTDTTLRQAAQETTSAGWVRAQRYIDWQADVVARTIAGNQKFRPARFISMDMEAPDVIAQSSIVNTPPSMRSMDMFSHALARLHNPKEHIVGDIRHELPFPDNTITLINCIDGWPFHAPVGRSAGELQEFADEALTILSGLYKKLAFGGQLVIFPWALKHNGPRERKTLASVVSRLALEVHHGIGMQTYHRDVLADWMTPGDEDVAKGLSPLFQNHSTTFQSLTLRKPRESLAIVHRNAAKQAAGRVASRAQTQSSPNPMP